MAQQILVTQCKLAIQSYLVLFAMQTCCVPQLIGLEAARLPAAHLDWLTWSRQCFPLRMYICEIEDN